MKIIYSKIWLMAFCMALVFYGSLEGAMAAGSETKNRPPNHLLNAESPYLQQHIYNTVDWYPWGDEALEKAKTEGKPIFLSIGYSTCHWCHVMARESFDNEQIGKFLNDNFVSIKIDRERRPDLDEQFMLVTQVIAGNGGWPNSVFLTADGKPFYAGTYFPPDGFLKVLAQINGLWISQNSDVQAEGERISTIIRNYMNRTEAAKDLTPEAIRAAARDMLSGIDAFNGGFGVAPKFPQESTLLFMLDQAQRDGDKELLTTVTNALDGMLKGGIHDHVGGGFHRYSTDPEWLVPHFEKMLYNQAMIGRLLVRAWAATGEIRYKYAATRTFDYVLREMRDAKGGFYSAQDADSLSAGGEEGEGFFYIWTPEEFDKLLGDDTTFALNALGVVPGGNFEGASVLHMNALPKAVAKAAALTEEAYLERLEGVLKTLYQARENRIAPHKDEKIVVAWNAAMIETLAEASAVFSRPDYYKAAADAARYILDEMLVGDVLKRVSYEGSVAVDAQLPDVAGFGAALLALHDYAPDEAQREPYLQAAKDMAAHTIKLFSSDSGAYRMTSRAEGIGDFLPLGDNEIPSGNALALSLFTGLAKRTNDVSYPQKATVLAAALSGTALASAGSGGYTLLGAQALAQGETGTVRYLADGAVRVLTKIDHANTKILFEIQVKDGWHINASKPLEDYFIPTHLSVNDQDLNDKQYPDPIVKVLKFNDSPMALYEGNVVLSSDYSAVEGGKPGQAVLKLQACSDQICLLPEEVVVRIWKPT